MLGLGTMFATGTTAIISTKLGQGKRHEANSNFTMIIIFVIGMGIAISLISWIFLKDIIYFLGANESIYEYCRAYAFPLVFFVTASLLQIIFQSIFVANGQPKVGLILTIIGGIANIILDYVFIAIFDMGIAGAAIATGIGYAIPAIYGLLYFTFNRKHNFYFVKPSWDTVVLSKAISNGSSEMVTNLSTSITTLLLNYLMMSLIGENGVAAIAILLYLDFIMVAISLGYTIGIAPIISYNYGQENHSKLSRLHKISLKFSFVVGISMFVITFVFADGLANIFTIKGTEVYNLAVSGLRIFAFSYLFKGYNIYASGLFTALGNGKISAALSFLRTLVFLVISILVFSYLLGMDGVWLSIPFAELLAIMTSIWAIKKYKEVYLF